jgi:hypothetical protein
MGGAFSMNHLHQPINIFNIQEKNMKQIKKMSCQAMKILLGIFALYIALCNVAQAACTPSISGSSIPSAASLCDNANNSWTVASGVVQVNGANAGYSDQVIVLLWQGGTIYQENASHLWWSWTNNNWVSTPAPESLSGATIPQSPQLNDSVGNYWTVVNGVIRLNGNDQVGTQNVVLLLYYNHVVYQKNAAGGWWKWSNNSWVVTTDPRACATSADNTTIPNATSICDAAGAVWTVASGVIRMNGADQIGTQNVIVLLWQGGILYQENASHLWWKWVNNAWVSTAQPESASGTTIPSSPQLNDSNGNYWTLLNGVVQINGANAGFTDQVTLLLYYNHVIYQQNAAGGWWYWNGSWVATTDPRVTPPAPTCTQSTVAPLIATKAAWDTHFFGITVPDLSTDGGDMAWTLYYWVRAYVSMALTTGDTKYLDRAVVSIDHMLAYENSGGGWGTAPLYNQLGTAQVSQAIMQFVYTVNKDPRFVAYRAKADTYLARAERAVHMFDYQWIDNSPVLGASFYRYATCGTNGASLCGTDALLMYNQGASMAKSLLLMDRVYRMKGQTPPSGYFYKADKAANYFLKFAQNVDGGYLWRYEGGRPGNAYEDTNHGHVDMSFLISAGKFHIGGLTDADMLKMAATLKNKILNGQPGPNDVAVRIDGTVLPSSSYDRVTPGYDWIDLADYDPAILGKVVNVFNRYLTNFNVARGSLGWAEILRKNSCTSLY